MEGFKPIIEPEMSEQNQPEVLETSADKVEEKKISKPGFTARLRTLAQVGIASLSILAGQQKAEAQMAYKEDLNSGNMRRIENEIKQMETFETLNMGNCLVKIGPGVEEKVKGWQGKGLDLSKKYLFIGPGKVVDLDPDKDSKEVVIKMEGEKISIVITRRNGMVEKASVLNGEATIQSIEEASTEDLKLKEVILIKEKDKEIDKINLSRNILKEKIRSLLKTIRDDKEDTSEAVKLKRDKILAQIKLLEEERTRIESNGESFDKMIKEEIKDQETIASEETKRNIKNRNRSKKAIVHFAFQNDILSILKERSSINSSFVSESKRLINEVSKEGIVKVDELGKKLLK